MDVLAILLLGEQDTVNRGSTRGELDQELVARPAAQREPLKFPGSGKAEFDAGTGLRRRRGVARGRRLVRRRDGGSAGSVGISGGGTSRS